MFRFQVFEGGPQTDMSGTRVDFTEEILREIAESYDPAKWRAPLVLGHPAADDPAWGWVDKVNAEGSRLFVEGEEVTEAIVGMVNSKLYQNVSVSLYQPDHPANPTPGRYSLRHVGLLGALPPAVKGLPTVRFGEGAFAEFMGPEGDAQAAKAAADKAAADKAAADKAAKAVSDKVAAAKAAADKAAADKAARFAELEAREAVLAQREAAVKVAEARTASGAFVEGLISEGRLLPVHKTAWTGLLAALPADGALQFSETEQVSPRAALERLLKEMPKVVEFKEVGGATTAPIDVDSQDAEALSRRILAYQESQRQLGRLIGPADALAEIRAGKERK